MESSIYPLQAEFANAFARDWAEAWNSHDLERILSHYADEAILSSPIALQRFGGDGTIRGKAALGDYFARGLQAFPDLRFDLIEVLWGTETIIVGFHSSVRQGKAAEVMLLNAGGKVTRIWANYDK